MAACNYMLGESNHIFLQNDKDIVSKKNLFVTLNLYLIKSNVKYSSLFLYLIVL